MPVVAPVAQPAPPVLYWRDQLAALCRQRGLQAPQYQPFSDRRGEYTAWTTHVFIHGYGSFRTDTWVSGNHTQDHVIEQVSQQAYNWILTYPPGRSS